LQFFAGPITLKIVINLTRTVRGDSVSF